MSVIGRLWRRAPAWRMSVGVALACTALAAMFPPERPRWPGAGAGFASTPVPAEAPAGAAAGAARYVPQPDTPPLTYSTVEMPPLAAGRETLVPHAGRLMPLPTGAWQEVAYARDGGSMAAQASLLDRVEAGRLTALLLVAAPAPVGRVAGPVAIPPLCVAPDALAHEVVPAGTGQDPTAHECWTLTVADMTELAAPAAEDVLLRQGLGRLKTLHVTVPDHMLVVRFVRSDAGGWMAAAIFLPDRRAQSAGAIGRLQDWARRFERLFHRGFDGVLPAGDVTAALARDPQG